MPLPPLPTTLKRRLNDNLTWGRQVQLPENFDSKHVLKRGTKNINSGSNFGPNQPYVRAVAALGLRVWMATICQK